MQIGFASTDITPSIGMEQPGSLGKQFHTRIHDPLCVKAVVIEDEEQSVALVGIDALSVKRSVVQAARAVVEEKTGIPAGNIMVGASHTHSGGPTVGARPGDFAHAFDRDFCEDIAQNHATAPDLGYLEYVTSQIATAVIMADEHKQEALLSVGSGQEPTVAFNRRFKMRDGTQMTHPGKGNPDIVQPAGPTDPEVGVVAAWRPNGDFLGCIVNFTCHGTTANPGASADWIYWLRQTITGGMHGGEVVFLNGACGDVTQVDNLSLQEHESGAKWSRRVGQKVGAEALKVLSMAEPAQLLPLAARQKILKIKTREVSEAHFQEALSRLKSDAPEGYECWYVRDAVLLHEYNKVEPEVICEVQAIQIGPVAFVSNPSEYFCEFGLSIKARSQFPYTYVAELANGCIGYVPTPETMGPQGGGYEPRLAMSSKLVPQAGQMIADASVELLNTLTPGAMPPTPQVKVEQTPWDAGRSDS